jgi:hypothetical protein
MEQALPLPPSEGLILAPLWNHSNLKEDLLEEELPEAVEEEEEAVGMSAAYGAVGLVSRSIWTCIYHYLFHFTL